MVSLVSNDRHFAFLCILFNLIFQMRFCINQLTVAGNTATFFFIEVHLISQESERSCLGVLLVSTLFLYTILIYLSLELFRQCGMLLVFFMLQVTSKFLKINEYSLSVYPRKLISRFHNITIWCKTSIVKIYIQILKISSRQSNI